MEREIFAILAKVDGMGGTVKAIEAGWFQREIADSAYAEALARESGEQTVIGVNKYVEAGEADPDIAVHPYDPETERRQIAALQRTRAERDNAEVARLMQKLREVAADESANIMPVTIELAEARASMGEIVECLKEIWGGYREVPVF
jgi:methylmalonyl-CoA mutase N-terminal domain/subunit